MIPETVAVIFLILPWACLIYIFRGVSSDDNPVWGNVLASGIGVIVSAMVAIWFFSGTIVSPSVVGNATYQLSSGSAVVNATTQLGTGGSGMFIQSPVSSVSGVNVSTVITVYTYNIIYHQYQNFGMMLLYGFIGTICAALFLWFIVDMRRIMQERDAYEDYGE
jgi:hypothetical protein